jgi:acyl carrier protein
VSETQILELIKAALDQVAPGKSAEINEGNMNMKMRDLAIDSVVTMEMIGYIEDDLGTTFPDEDLAQINKLSDLADLIRNVK